MDCRDVVFLDQTGRRHVCRDVAPAPGQSAERVAATRLFVKFDASTFRQEGDDFVLERARLPKSWKRETLRLTPAVAIVAKPSYGAFTPQAPTAALAEVAVDEPPSAGEPAVEDPLDPARLDAIHAKWRERLERTCCSYGQCGRKNYVGAKWDDRNKLGRYFCTEHWAAPWANVWAEDERCGGPVEHATVNIGRAERKASA